MCPTICTPMDVRKKSANLLLVKRVVINSFLVVLSLAVIPLLLQKDVSPDYSQSMPINAQIAQYQQYTNDPYQYNSAHYPFDPSYNNSFQPTMAYS